MKFIVVFLAIVALANGQTTLAPTAAPTQPPTAAPTHPPTAAPTAAPTQPPTQPPTPPGPKPTITPVGPPVITLEVIGARLMSNPDLAKLVQQVTKVQQEITTLEKLFEVDLTFRNITLLNQILLQCKTIRTAQTGPILAEIQSQIASAKPQTFLNRLLLESMRIQIQSYHRAAKWIGLEVLGDLSEVSHFEKYYYSETVAIVRQLILARYFDMLKSSYEVDIILEEVQKKDPLTLHMDAATKTSVDKHLKDILATATAVRKEISQDYYSEIESIRLQGNELNILQRMDMEMNLDAVNDALGFITRYEELFLRINSV